MWITRVAIANPVFAAMVMLALCVLGLASYARLGVEQMPDISLPGAYVQVEYPGASPEAVERELSRPIELAANGVPGVKRIRSRSIEGRSNVDIEFALDADLNRAMQELRDRIAVLQGTLPRDAKAPTIGRFNNDNAQPVVSLALMGGDRPARELGRIAEQVVQRRLLRVPGIARVDMWGHAQRELRVDLDPARLRAYGVTPAELSAALREANADQPVGLLGDGARESLLRVEGRLREPADFADTVVARRNGLALKLSDLGQVGEREKETDAIARVNGQPAVGFAVFRQQDANAVATGDAVKAAMEELRGVLPPGTELRLIYANSDWVKRSLAGVQRTLVEGALLTVGIVFLFLRSWRSTVITGLTLPISVIAAFIAVNAFGYTLNFMTLMALSLCIGLLIDDAIVVRENIVRHHADGLDAVTAARRGTEEIGLAVMATTFALCAVFVPVAFMGGIVGRFFHPFGVTVAVAVLVSLFVSFTLDPMLSAVWPDRDTARLLRWPVVGPLLRGVERGMDALHARYDALLAWIFGGRRWTRAAVLGVGGASLVGALALVPLVGTEFVPQVDEGFTRLSLRMPEGASLPRTDAKARQVEALVRALPEVETVVSGVGGVGQRNVANLDIALKPRAERTRSQKQVEQAIRDAVAQVPGVEAVLGFDRPIYVAILGPDAEGLARVAADFAAQVKKIPGTVDVELSVRPGLPAYAVRLKPDAVRELGLTAPQLAASLRAYVNGDTATTWTAPDGEPVDVVLRLPEPQRRQAAQLASLPVAFARDGTPIPLEAVASVLPVFNPEVIRRQDLQRREAVFAGVSGRPAGEVGDEVRRLVERTALPPGYRFDIGGATQEQQEAFGAMLASMGLAVVFIYIVLASQFGSFLQPLAIMASLPLPLSLVGVMLALLVTRSTLNVFSMIGLVRLMGLVTKNAILLVDCANQARHAGATVAQALRTAGQLRLRPIVMTTAAMVFGMLPLALGLDGSGELQAPMGRAIIGGVLASTLLTLVVVPVVYSLLVREQKSVPAPEAPAAGGAEAAQAAGSGAAAGDAARA